MSLSAETQFLTNTSALLQLSENINNDWKNYHRKIKKQKRVEANCNLKTGQLLSVFYIEKKSENIEYVATQIHRSMEIHAIPPGMVPYDSIQ